MPDAAGVSDDPALIDAAAPATGEAPDLGFAVDLDAFSGPMDLLLFLVRKAEVDINDIPIATIADQFVAVIGSRPDLDLEQAGDFILLAAMLLEMKVRAALPPDPAMAAAGDDEPELLDPRASLVSRLLAFRACKESAERLAAREEDARRRIPRGLREEVPDDPDEVPDLELGQIGAGTLAQLWRVLERRIAGYGPRTVLADDVPLDVRITAMEQELERSHEADLRALMDAEPNPLARVALVQAALEGARRRLYRVRQEQLFGRIHLSYRPPAERAVAPNTNPEPPETLPPRKRRPPLVTYHGQQGEHADDTPVGDDEAPPQLSLEEQHLRALDEACAVDGMLAAIVDVDAAFERHWYTLHPELAPPPPAPPAPEPQAAKPARKVPAAKAQSEAPPPGEASTSPPVSQPEATLPAAEPAPPQAEPLGEASTSSPEPMPALAGSPGEAGSCPPQAQPEATLPAAEPAPPQVEPLGEASASSPVSQPEATLPAAEPAPPQAEPLGEASASSPEPMPALAGSPGEAGSCPPQAQPEATLPAAEPAPPQAEPLGEASTSSPEPTPAMPVEAMSAEQPSQPALSIDDPGEPLATLAEDPQPGIDRAQWSSLPALRSAAPSWSTAAPAPPPQPAAPRNAASDPPPRQPVAAWEPTAPAPADPHLPPQAITVTWQPQPPAAAAVAAAAAAAPAVATAVLDPQPAVHEAAFVVVPLPAAEPLPMPAAAPDPAPPVEAPSRSLAAGAPADPPPVTIAQPAPPRTAMPIRRTPPHWFLVAAVAQTIVAIAFIAALWRPSGVLEITAPAAQIAGREPLVIHANLDLVGGDVRPERAVQVTPAVPGAWSAVDARTLRFDPANDWPLATTVQAALDPSWRNPQGFRAAHAPGLALATPDPALSVHGLRTEAPGGWVLSAPVPLIAEHAAAITLVSPAGSHPLTIRQEGDGIAITAEQAPAGRAELVIPAGTRMTAGDRGLSTAVRLPVVVGHPATPHAVTALPPHRGAGEIRIETADSAIVADATAAAIVCEPPLALTARAEPGRIILRGAFTPGQRYRLTTAAAPGIAAIDATVAIPPAAPWAEVRQDSAGLRIQLGHLQSAELRWLDAWGATLATRRCGSGTLSLADAPAGATVAAVVHAGQELARSAVRPLMP